MVQFQQHAKKNIDMFHKSNTYSIHQCTVCHEAWPLKTNPCKEYRCLRCTKDKQAPKKFSSQNEMIPSIVPVQLQGLSQVEEMLIARALSIMSVYLKPGGQRGYSGHCVNLPQNIAKLANSLPRYPKDLSVILVKMKAKDNNFKNLEVRRQKVADALQWLINNNSQYKCIKINNSLGNLSA